MRVGKNRHRFHRETHPWKYLIAGKYKEQSIQKSDPL